MSEEDDDEDEVCPEYPFKVAWLSAVVACAFDALPFLENNIDSVDCFLAVASADAEPWVLTSVWDECAGTTDLEEPTVPDWDSMLFSAPFSLPHNQDQVEGFLEWLGVVGGCVCFLGPWSDGGGGCDEGWDGCWSKFWLSLTGGGMG